MKRKISNILFGLLFLVGFGVLVYPTVSNQWNTYRQNQLITNYENVVSEMEEDDFSKEWESAYIFNQKLLENNIYADAFGSDSLNIEETEYWNVLNVSGDGVMGYLSIPKINVKISIYHGTGDNVLQTGAGHLNGSKLPIGGESTHSILAAHRGLPSARLFTDIDQLQKGDMFYIHVLDKILAYQVDQILDMVDKDDVEALSKALMVETGKDQVSLFTCTPYGVNSHRLIVRGSRIPYNGEEETETTIPETMLQLVQDYYMIYLLMGLTVTFVVILVLRFLMGRKTRKDNEK